MITARTNMHENQKLKKGCTCGCVMTTELEDTSLANGGNLLVYATALEHVP
jgi:hypothetical protein